MSINYARELPHDKNGVDLQEFAAPYKANATYSANNAVASSVITLNDNTTVVEVTAIGAPVSIRWIPSTETAAVAPFASVITDPSLVENFDNVIPKDYYRRFVVPIEKAGVSSVVGIGVQSGTYRRIAIISGNTPSSVMTTEF